MPGVPSGKACEACRKQKKKCDEKQPSCGRCLRLKIPCVGSGQQRFKFQEEKQFTKQIRRQFNNGTLPTPSSSSISSSSSGTPSPPGQLLFIQARPSSSTTRLAQAFTQAIQRSTDIRYNLGWNFGMFLEDVPRRLGTNEALDRAVDAITSAHTDFCTRKHGSVQALTKYSAALRTLRVYLDDPVHAQDTNTLAAVMILLICQSIMGQTTKGQWWSGHAEGAMQILKARKEFGPRNDFEAKIYMSLRGSVLFEGLFNHRIQLSEKEWDSLIVNEYDGSNPEGRLLQTLSRAPGIMRRARMLLRTGSDPTGVQDELWALYQACKLDVHKLKQSSLNKDLSLAEALPHGFHRAWLERVLTVHYDRIYGIGLVITLFFNCMVQALGIHSDAVQADAHHFIEEILMLAEISEDLRPVGSGYLIICLTTAWAATTEPELRGRVFEWLYEYQTDFNNSQVSHLQQELQWTAEHLCLGDPLGLRQELDYMDYLLD